MFRRLFNTVGITLLLASPVAAQFGVGGKKKGASFQELNEQMKNQQDGAGGMAGMAGMGDLQKMMGDLDPKLLEEMAALGPQFDEAMKMMAQMSPEELEKQMKDAMEMLQSGDMMENMLKHQEEILKTLEETGQIDQEELMKFKTDPEYFEQKMRESFGQMKSMFSDPEVLKVATESMKGISDMFTNPEAINSALASMMEGFDDDEKLEEVRQMLLADPGAGGAGGMGELFSSPEMKEILNDPKKWKETLREGKGLLQGAGVGEL